VPADAEWVIEGYLGEEGYLRLARTIMEQFFDSRRKIRLAAVDRPNCLNDFAALRRFQNITGSAGADGQVNVLVSVQR